MGCYASAEHCKAALDAPRPTLLRQALAEELSPDQKDILETRAAESHEQGTFQKRLFLVDHHSDLEVCGLFTKWKSVTLRKAEAIDSQIAALVEQWMASVASTEAAKGDENAATTSATADNPEATQRRDGMPFLFKKNGEWATYADFATAPATDYPDVMRKLEYSGPNVQVMFETYEWTITNGVRDVHLKLTECSKVFGHFETRGASDLWPGSRTNFKVKADFLGRLHANVKYTAHISGKDLEVGFYVTGGAGERDRMWTPTVSDPALLQVPHTGRNWTVKDTCAAGWHWDSDVDACVKNDSLTTSWTSSSEMYSISEKQSFRNFAESTTGQVVEKIIQFGLGKIPYVGGLLSGMVGIFWPSSGTDPKALWDSMEKYAEVLFDAKMVQHDKEQFLQILEVVANRSNEIKDAHQSRKGQILNSCITECDILKKLVTDDFEMYFSVGISVLTLHLTLHIMYLDLDKKIWPVPLNQAEIDQQYETINDSLKYQERLRKLMADLTKKRGNTTYDERAVAIEMDVYWDMVRVWPAMFKGLDLARLTGPIVVEDRKNYVWPVGVKSTTSSFIDKTTTHIKEVVVRSGHWLDGIRFTHDRGVTSGFHGQKSGFPSVQYLDDDEYIDGVTGSADIRIYLLVFHTTKGRTMRFTFQKPGRGKEFWTSIPIAPILGRDVLLAVHGGVSPGCVDQLYFEFGPMPSSA